MSRDERFKIYIEQLRDGHIEKIKLEVPPDSLELNDSEVHFVRDVSITGDVYIAGHELVFHLDIKAQAKLLCSICNEEVEKSIIITGLYETVPLEDFKDGLFFMQDIIREAILLETPAFVECSGGVCPQRKDVERFLKKAAPNIEERFHPFANFDFDKTSDS